MHSLLEAPLRLNEIPVKRVYLCIEAPPWCCASGPWCTESSHWPSPVHVQGKGDSAHFAGRETEAQRSMAGSSLGRKEKEGACAFAAPLPSCFPSITEQASLPCLPLVSASCSGTAPLAPIRTQLLSKSPFSSLSCGLPPTDMGYLRRSSGLRNLSFARDVGILKGALEV